MWNWVSSSSLGMKKHTHECRVAITTYLMRKVVEIGNQVGKIQEKRISIYIEDLHFGFFGDRNISHMVLFIFLIEICSKKSIFYIRSL